MSEKNNDNKDDGTPSGYNIYEHMTTTSPQPDTQSKQRILQSKSTENCDDLTLMYNKRKKGRQTLLWNTMER